MDEIVSESAHNSATNSTNPWRRGGQQIAQEFRLGNVTKENVDGREGDGQ